MLCDFASVCGNIGRSGYLWGVEFSGKVRCETRGEVCRGIGGMCVEGCREGNTCLYTWRMVECSGRNSRMDLKMKMEETDTLQCA